MEAIKHTLLQSTLAVALLASGASFAAPPGPATSGQLVIINSLGNADATTGALGTTASAVSVVVNDQSGPCSSTANLAYNGTVVVKWGSATHSATSCMDITSVAVTPLKATIGAATTVIYSSAVGGPAPTATATIFTPPTASYANMALIINGSGIPATAVTATARIWGVGVAAQPVFDAGNGSLATVGVPGAIGIYGLKAEKVMRHYAVLPIMAEIN